MGIDPTYYEAAMVDSASKWQQIKHVTLPQLVPLMTILTILAVGNIFRADFHFSTIFREIRGHFMM